MSIAWAPPFRCPGIDLDAVALFQAQQQAGGIYGLLNLFSGGALEQFSVFALGIIPYITASIIMQLLTVVIPKLQSLQEEGESGRKVITQWTRYLTVILALIQSTGFTFLFHSGRFTNGIDLIPNYTPGRVILIVLTMTAGTAMVMWLGELITQRGVGNGMSLIIFVSILSQFPFIFGQIWSQTGFAGLYGRFIVIMAVFLLMIVAIIYVDQGSASDPDSIRQTSEGAKGSGWPVHLHPAEGQYSRRHPGDLRHLSTADPHLDNHGYPLGCRLASEHLPLVRHQPRGWSERNELVVRGDPVWSDRVLHLLLHGDSVRPGAAGGDDPTAGWVHSWR